MKAKLSKAKRSTENLTELIIDYRFCAEISGVVRCIAIEQMFAILRQRKDVRLVRCLDNRIDGRMVVEIEQNELHEIEVFIFW